MNIRLVHLASSRHGLTLIEVLLYLALATSLTVLISAVSLHVLGLTKKADTVAEVQYGGDLIMATVERLLSEAVSVTAPLPGESGDSLVFTRSESTRSPTIISVEDGVLYVREGSEPAYRLQSTGLETDLSVHTLMQPGSSDAVRFGLVVTAAAASLQKHFESTATFTTSYKVYPTS